LGAPEDISRTVAGKSPRADWVDVPRLALGASAGPGAFLGDEQAIGAFRFAARWLRSQGLDPSQLSAIAVSGDSMEPTLRDGDEILVDRSRRGLSDGIHVVRTGDALMVKRLDTARPGAIALVSDNPAYRPIELPVGEVEVIGRVVWKSGRL
jgi:phage repressor protein C with HTH and peptisase S24 domain